MRHTNVVELKPGEMAGFELQFVPRFDTLFNCTLKLHIVDNPFESISVREPKDILKLIVYQ